MIKRWGLNRVCNQTRVYEPCRWREGCGETVSEDHGAREWLGMHLKMVFEGRLLLRKSGVQKAYFHGVKGDGHKRDRQATRTREWSKESRALDRARGLQFAVHKMTGWQPNPHFCSFV